MDGVEETVDVGPGAAPLGRAPVTRSDLATGERTLVQRGRGFHPDVLLVRAPGGGEMVVKDFAPRPGWVRRPFGRWLSRREARIYRILDGHPNVPRWLGRVDALAFAVEYRPGVPVTRSHAERFTEGFADALEAAVEGLHASGVVHLDLRHRSNVLAGDDGRPVVIDFGSAVHLRPQRIPGRWLLPWLARFDRRALAKWRGNFARYRSEGAGAAASSSAGATSEGGRGASRPT